MISIYGRSSAPATPRKHNHFVPDGYIPPKNRQKVVSPPQRRLTTLRPILKTAASSRTTTPTRRQLQSPNYAPAQPPSSKVSLVPRRNLMKQGFPHSNHNVFPNAAVGQRQTSPGNRPRSILKSPNSSSRKMLAGSCPVGTPGTASPRVMKSASTSPHVTARSQSPAGSSSQQGCYVGGFFEDHTPPASTQKIFEAPMHKKVLESIRKDNIPPYEGSYIDSSPISVVDKYDERDNPIWWKQTYPPCRRGPPSKSSLRPHARHPNILFNRVVDSQQPGRDDFSSCSSTQSYENNDHSYDGNDQQGWDPHWWHPNYEPCCAALDWDHDPALKNVGYDDRQAHRQCKLEDYLREVCIRDATERFVSYLIRCYAYANEELNSQKAKHLLGYVDEHLSALDVWVLRLHRGTVSRLLRSGTAYSGRDNELFLRMLREECMALDSERCSMLRRHLNATERRVEACDEQERNYKKILLLSQRSPMGVMQNLKRRDWR